jgi:hypothetical protein
MKINKHTAISFGLLILMAAMYRALPGRVWGFAPHIAMAIFAGSVIKDRKLAFALPLISLFVSDLLYQIMYLKGMTPIAGFYSGQWQNYLLIGSLTVIGYGIRRTNLTEIFTGSLAGPMAYFLISNLMVWIGGGGYGRPATFTGLLQCYADGLPFLRTSLFGTFFFSTILFGGHYLITRFFVKKPQIA